MGVTASLALSIINQLKTVYFLKCQHIVCFLVHFHLDVLKKTCWNSTVTQKKTSSFCSQAALESRCSTVAQSRHFMGKLSPQNPLCLWKSPCFETFKCDKYASAHPLSPHAMLLGTLPSAPGPMFCLSGLHWSNLGAHSTDSALASSSKHPDGGEGRKRSSTNAFTFFWWRRYSNPLFKSKF